ncbi:MAG: glutamate synthase-related protein, partial [Anaerolineaceae bacterium]|nr:glutamate synthase-related protein [Anaerolineaceae bacterium]
VPYELERFAPELRAVYTRIRQGFGPYAQGPAAVLARYANTIVASVDALGLRPLWFIDTEKDLVFSSERGAIPMEAMIADPVALGPGEKVAVILHRGENPEVLDHAQMRQFVMNRAFEREAPQMARQYWIHWERERMESSHSPLSAREMVSEVVIAQKESEPPLPQIIEPDREDISWRDTVRAGPIDNALLSANGWNQDQILEVADTINKSKEISSLGYDGPLAVLSRKRVNVTDFFKETVAVVTNPAIDRNREAEAFSTSSLFGARPAIGKAPAMGDRIVAFKIPLLTGGHPALGSESFARELASQFGAYSINHLLETFSGVTAWLVLGVMPGEDVRGALDRLTEQAVQYARKGIQCLVLDDGETIENGWGWLDPALASSRVDEALRSAGANPKENLRRKVGVVLRSAAIRNLHDIILMLGFGADAINCYALFAVATQKGQLKNGHDQAETAQIHLMNSLKAGMEKVTSTMGCHELRGYGRVGSSIGLAPSVANILKSPNFFGSESTGMNWERLDRESVERGQELAARTAVRSLERVDHFYPKFWKKVGSFTRSQTDYGDVLDVFNELKEEIPVSLRHLLGFKRKRGTALPGQVDLSVGDYDLPFVISAMSYGSQGEASFRAYAEAASRLNMMCINGEGGELPAIMGKYKKNRGQQVASGRFGVNARFLDSAAVIEIKIGQGAKPGEGGMLPAYKVTPEVAEARHTPAYVSLMSPSNNHDLYSIEDLAQLVEELKVVNPHARVSVKCPVVPGIGVIAVGIAKAGADIISISGYDGGTGAARKHALQYAGLPAEIGVIQAHRALVEAGLRHKVEIWTDGGMKTGEDVVKMILLGANRVGFGTMAMVAIGCSICRKCEEGTCFVGIATQIRSEEEAQLKGLKVFTALEFNNAVERLVRLFRGMEEEVRQITARLGGSCLQDLVGRGALLEQVGGLDRIDLSAMLEDVPIRARVDQEPGVGRLLVRPRNNLTRLLSELITETIMVDDEKEITYQDTVMAIDRALGSHIVGALARHPEVRQRVEALHLRFGPSSVAGNGFSAWVSDPLDIIIEGGAQDGTAKGASGGRVAIMKGVNHDGLRIDGSVGKSFAYGAQKGIFIVQGNADSRACIRLSGADVVLGGEITHPVTEESLYSSTYANLKGYACEYMTAGRVVIMGDPGPYAFSGMTGGVVFQMLTPTMGFDEQALKRRIALGAQVEVKALEEHDLPDLCYLLQNYVEALEQTYQYDTADYIRSLMEDKIVIQRFVKVVPWSPEAMSEHAAELIEDMAE